MQIAILFTGHIRTLNQTYQSFNHAFTGLNPNIFCHTWNKISHQDHVWYSKDGDGNLATRVITPNDFIHYLKPKKFQIDIQQKYVSDNPKYNEVGGYSAVHSQWESIKKAWELMLDYERKNNIKFDVVIKTRYDLFYNNKIDINELKDVVINKNIIYVLKTPHTVDHRIYSDIMIIAPRDIYEKIVTGFPVIMDKYFDIAILKHKIIEGEYPLTVYLSNNKYFGCTMKYSNLKLNLIRLNNERIPLFL
jgi:hypothetical protein